MAKKINKKNKQQNFKTKIMILIFFLVFGIGAGYFGYLGYNEVKVISAEIENYIFQIPAETNENLILPTKINDHILISWKSSDEEIITPTGLVNRPSYQHKDVNVSLTAYLEIDYQQFLSSYLESFILDSNFLEQTFKIKVYKAEPNPIQIATEILNKLYIPTEIYSSITLPQSCYLDDVNITWVSSNLDVMKNDGTIITPLEDTIINLQAVINFQGIVVDKDFTITVKKEDFSLVIIDDIFDDYQATSRYLTIKTGEKISYENARIINENNEDQIDETETNITTPSYLKLRNKDGQEGSFNINNIQSPLIFHFEYMFSGSQVTESSILKVIVTYQKNNICDVYQEEIIVRHYDYYLSYSLDLSHYDEVSINVTHKSSWSGETFINIDNVYVSSKIVDNNLESWLINNMPTTISSSLMLPTTTIYGGSITWTSNNDIISHTGLVTLPATVTLVTLIATINYQNKILIVTLEVKVKGTNSSSPLEIYFIDIGKYGVSDCGESIYIKYNNIDIIVDAGDHFDATKQAIEEVINQHLEDGVIEYVIATHPDADHIGGMANLFEKYQIDKLIKFEGEKNSQKFINMKNAYQKEGCEVYQIYSDIILQNKHEKYIVLDDEIFISFIDTTYYLSDESNGKSIVFVLEAYGTKILMTGDADNASGHNDLEKKYMNQVGDIDILKVVHHGTANGTSNEFLNIVKPEIAIVCNGNYLGNKHGHPTPKAIGRLYNYYDKIKVYAICGGGTIDGEVTPSGTYKCSSEDRFTQRNGTITILVDNNGYIFSSEYYQDNILEFAATQYWQAIVTKGLN